MKRLAHRHTAVHLRGEDAHLFSLDTHWINFSRHIIIEGRYLIGLFHPRIVSTFQFWTVRKIVCLIIRPHLVFHEDILDAQIRFGIIKSECWGEGNVVVKSVGLCHLCLHLERCLLGLLLEDVARVVERHVYLLLAINPSCGKSSKSKEVIVLHRHRFYGVSLWSVHSNDHEGHIFEFFVQAFDSDDASRAEAAPSASAFFDDLHTRIEHIVLGIGVRFDRTL